jgi:hypothetical protein
MAPFIKFSKPVQSTTGAENQLHFINAACILKAFFDESTGRLQITLTSDPNKVAFTLEGEEAKKALAILQQL